MQTNDALSALGILDVDQCSDRSESGRMQMLASDNGDGSIGQAAQRLLISAAAVLLLLIALMAAGLVDFSAEAGSLWPEYESVTDVEHDHADRGAALCSGAGHCSTSVTILMGPQLPPVLQEGPKSGVHRAALSLPSQQVTPANRPPIRLPSA